MVASTKFRIGSLNFAEIKAGLISFMKDQPDSPFTDFNFEASGISTILDVLAYNTHYQGLLANFAANEMFLDTAVKRSSVVSHAKALGYNPKSVTSAKAIINVVISNAGSFDGVLPVGTKFITQINNKSYTFSTLETKSVSGVSGTYTFTDLKIYEGYYVTNELSWNGVDATINIPNNQCDLSTLRVDVFDENSVYEEYIPVTNILEVDGTSRVFFTQEGYAGNEIYFGDGNLGFAPVASVSAPTNVRLRYIATNGADGNGAQVFSLSSSLGPGTSSAITTITLVQQSGGGAAPESVASIKLQALNHYGAQNRAVIADDYITLIRNLGVNTKAVLCWGGEDNVPPKFGSVMVCVEPIIGDTISSSDQAQISTMLKTKAVANSKFEFVDPDYIDIILNSYISYKLTQLATSVAELEASVKDVIIQYVTNNLMQFGSSFRYSNLSAKIDLSNDVILSNTMQLQLLKKVVIGSGTTDVTVEFNNELSSTSINPVVTTNTFTMSGVADIVWYEDDKNGKMQIVTIINGVKKVLSSNAGTVNYTSGKIYLNPQQYTSINGSYLEVKGIPAKNDIFSSKNIIIRITTDNVFVNSISQ